MWFLLLIWYLFAFTFLATLIYVSATYLLLIYDQRLGDAGEVAPVHHFLHPPSTWDRYKGFLLEIGATFLSVLTWPWGEICRWPRRSGWGMAQRPIILIHGLRNNQGSWWYYKNRLKRAGLGPRYSLRLNTRKKGIPACGKQLEGLVERVLEETKSQQVILIGHSMGGLVAAYYAHVLGGGAKVSDLITVGSPLQGTRLAHFLPGGLIGEMRPGRPFLKELEKRILSETQIRTYHLASQLDNLIYPLQSALFTHSHAPAYRRKLLSFQGHLTLLYSPAAINQIIAWIQGATTTPIPLKESQTLPSSPTQQPI